MNPLLLPFLASLLPLALTANTEILDPTQPIYLGDVFWPPSMTFIAWLPSAHPETDSLTEWCYRATDASNHNLFSLGTIDALQIHDYFSAQAFITREGRRFADCYITPESGRMGACEGVVEHDCIGGHRFTGPGTRRWSCWVVEGEREGLMTGRGLDGRGGKGGDGLTKGGEGLTRGKEERMGTVGSSEVLGAFTAGFTGR